jgi:MHS family proline/betaine transporter-like MFS transporter
MGLTTALIGVIPSYASIGVAAPILVVILRCIQGMMVGGEWSTAATYLGESAPANRRGLHASLVTATAGLAFLVGTVVAATINGILTPQEVSAWG